MHAKDSAFPHKFYKSYLMVETKIITLSDTQEDTLLENVKGHKWK